MRNLIGVLSLVFALSGPFMVKEAMARGGGGHSYSGSSRSGSSRSSGSSGSSSHSYSGSSSGHSSYGSSGEGSDSGVLIFVLFFFLVLLVLVFASKSKTRMRLDEGEPSFNPNLIKAGLQELLCNDSAFSMPLFRDFCYALYSTLHHARGMGSVGLKKYSAYLGGDAFLSLFGLQDPAHGRNPVIGVVIGSFGIQNIDIIKSSNGEGEQLITVLFQGNFTEDRKGEQKSFYSEELWTFSRKSGLQSRYSEDPKQISCPSCGAPAQSDGHGKCSGCGQVVRAGVLDWGVKKIEILELSDRPPLLTSTVEEEGTDFETIFDPDLATMKEKLLSELKVQDFSSLKERAKLTFLQLQNSWSARNLSPLRPFETDALYETHSYWIQEYKKQKLINRLDQVSINDLELCRIEMDQHYVSATLRIHAGLLDWTENESGDFVCGNRSKIRRFSEYWTFIRSRKIPDPKGNLDQCPACGAPLKISQTGVCEYCKSKITSGQFDWILSSIEQDEAYEG
jgi:hypothetical protein